MAVHVEDHPLGYFDFEGVIPAGEYGGGDVIVWDWGTWQLTDADDPIAAVEAGDLHFDLFGEKLHGHFALVRRGAPGAREQWMLFHKRDEHAVDGWDAEDHPRSVKTGRTNDEVKASPAATWSSNALWNAPDADELAALDELPARGGQWQVGAHTLKLTNLDKVLIPAKRPHKAVTKRDLIRHYASIAPAILPYLADRPINLHRYPDGIDKPGFWHKARPTHAPEWLRSWRNDEADPGETEVYSVLDSAAALAWAANFGAIELHPWTSTTDHPHQPTWAMVDIDPGTSSSFDDVVTLATLHRTALAHIGVEACPKLTGRRGIQIWIPVAPALHVRRHQGVGRTAVADHRRHRPRHGELGMGEVEAQGPGPARLHPERDQQDAGRPLQRAPRRRCAGVGADQLGRARRPGSAPRPLDDPHDRRAPGRRRRPARPADRQAADAARPVLSGISRCARDPQLNRWLR